MAGLEYFHSLHKFWNKYLSSPAKQSLILGKFGTIQVLAPLYDKIFDKSYIF
jgi:hypothetical protein